jgi:hypothetical protein
MSHTAQLADTYPFACTNLCACTNIGKGHHTNAGQCHRKIRKTVAEKKDSGLRIPKVPVACQLNKCLQTQNSLLKQ